MQHFEEDSLNSGLVQESSVQRQKIEINIGIVEESKTESEFVNKINRQSNKISEMVSVQNYPDSSHEDSELPTEKITSLKIGPSVDNRVRAASKDSSKVSLESSPNRPNPSRGHSTQDRYPLDTYNEQGLNLMTSQPEKAGKTGVN